MMAKELPELRVIYAEVARVMIGKLVTNLAYGLSVVRINEPPELFLAVNS